MSNVKRTTYYVGHIREVVNRYKELNVWKEAMGLCTDVYKLTAGFPDSEKFGLTSQLNRSAVSIPSNIAEGAGRPSEKQFASFLGIANGSCNELYTQLEIASRIGLLNENELLEFEDRIEKIQNMIFKLKRTFSK